jgi:hypothetical protein
MKHDLIFSRALNNGTLNAERIQQLAPAVYTDEKGPARSARYAHINTSQAINILADYGYQVTQAAQVRGRTAEANKYGQHLVALSNPDLPELPDGRPEIILYNSGDGKSAVRMFSGFYRFICSNGLVAGNGFEVKAAHYQTTANRFEEMITEAAQRLPDMLTQIEQLRDVRLDYQQELGLAIEAAKIRWKSHQDAQSGTPGDRHWLKPGTYTAGSTAWNLLKVNRSEDMELNAWITFNRIQEGLIRGGAEVLSVTNKTPAGKIRKAKAVRSVASSLKINRDLWDLFDLDKLEKVAA